MTNKPIESFKSKGIEIAIWLNQNGNKSFSISKKYKDKNSGEWKETKYFFESEIEFILETLNNYCKGYKQEEQQLPSVTMEEVIQKINDDIPF